MFESKNISQITQIFIHVFPTTSHIFSIFHHYIPHIPHIEFYLYLSSYLILDCSDIQTQNCLAEKKGLHSTNSVVADVKTQVGWLVK